MTRRPPFPRTLLAVPASSPRLLASAVGAVADGLMLDLEDGVRSADKDLARAELEKFTTESVIAGRSWVRINAADSPEHAADLALIERISSRIAGVVLAKSTRATVESLVVPEAVSIIALIESARGVEDAFAIADHATVAGVMFGELDYVGDIVTSGGIRFAAPDWARSRIVNASAAAGISAIAGPTVETSDQDVIRRDAQRDAALGFAGKLCIHPAQLPLVAEIFGPSPEQLAWATRVLEAAESATSGAFTVDGRMVDAPVVATARRLLDEQTRSER